MAIILTLGPFFDTSTKAGLSDSLGEWIGSKVDVRLAETKTLSGVTLLAVSDYGIVIETRRNKTFVNERNIATITLN